MIPRRNLLIALAASPFAVALPALAQQPARVRRIGYFSGSTLQSNAAWLAAFREGMAALRWVENRDYVIDARYGNGNVQATSSLAAALVASKPDLLLVSGDDPARPLVEKTKTIPIVFAIAADPVGNGLVASLQRPGGNATGLTSLVTELGPKRLQLLKEAFPRVTHVGLLYEPDNKSSVTSVKEIEVAAPRLGLRVTPIELRQTADIEPAIKRGAALGAHAYLVISGGFINTQRQAIVDRMMRARIPAFYASFLFVDLGGLISYGSSGIDNFRRAATYVDKIFKGAKPGDLPIEQPTRFEMVVNMKTAKAMGFTIPQSILLQADRVIE